MLSGEPTVARRMTLWDDTRRALPQRVQPPVWPLAALAEQSILSLSAVENSVGLRGAADRRRQN